MSIPMSGDEVWVSVVSTLLAVYLWGHWYWSTGSVWPAQRPPAGRGFLWAAPLFAAALIGTVLRTVASHDVIDDGRYIYMYLAFGMAWTGLVVRTFPITGLSVRDDSVERRNPAAAPALAGAILGIAACYAGGNIGDGPGWWVVLISALLATAALLLLWQGLEVAGAVAEAITIERDEAAGWRLGGFLLSAGLVLGRSVAGDWVSSEDLLLDTLTVGWPVLVLLGIAIAFERTLHATTTRPHPPAAASGVMPALAMLALASAYVWWLGLPQ